MGSGMGSGVTRSDGGIDSASIGKSLHGRSVHCML